MPYISEGVVIVMGAVNPHVSLLLHLRMPALWHWCPIPGDKPLLDPLGDDFISLLFPCLAPEPWSYLSHVYTILSVDEQRVGMQL